MRVMEIQQEIVGFYIFYTGLVLDVPSAEGPGERDLVVGGGELLGSLVSGGQVNAASGTVSSG
jgi:hypothetical protein